MKNEEFHAGEAILHSSFMLFNFESGSLFLIRIIE
ncbi:unknown [Bacteroides sp. CAG:702]|nr:unknown [Bacteroides sp. CAG:702]